MCPEFSILMNQRWVYQTNLGLDSTKPPIKSTGWSPCRFIIVVSKRCDQTNFSNVESMLDTNFSSISGDCPNMAGALSITQTQ